MIKVSQLVFEYPGHRALDGVSVHIAAGTVTALVGPNGAGKSTLMRCIAGLDQPLSGQVQVHGIAVQEQPREVHRHLGYLSDFFGLYDRLSVRRCLQYAALSMGVLPSEAPQRVAHVAGQLGLADLLERLPTELSRGQRQRVAIGQAIVHQPRVLLLDEPASGLDPEARASLSRLMRALQAQGMTLIVSSHILSELDEYCTHILSLRGGRVESHEALHGGIKAPAAGGDAPLALYALELAPPPGASAGSLARQLHLVLPDTPVPPPDDQGLVHLQLWLPTLPRERADLLARLVGTGLPVASLAPVRERLQDRYARGLQNAATPTPAEQP
ncbi:ABC transporter ATP-binding protein [Delftia sp. CH05]|uniref:ABC transporter ATP-binding protein n=1 Tax=Delftia sp. CH05 TaxID=2692194 RepID=UPI00135DA2D9|nr:ABC transporter ATP-binding protein [Delftia sp. CH05]MXN27706.1 ATP-binding cassette domain-containing protein [Delftia sp. CH05]